MRFAVGSVEITGVCCSQGPSRFPSRKEEHRGARSACLHKAPVALLGFWLHVRKKSALIAIKLFHAAGTADSSKIAVTGQAGSHAPQSIHSSGLMNKCSLSSNPCSFWEGWMQSTGQTSTQVASFTPIHGCVMTYVIFPIGLLFLKDTDSFSSGLRNSSASRESSVTPRWRSLSRIPYRAARSLTGPESLVVPDSSWMIERSSNQICQDTSRCPLTRIASFLLLCAPFRVSTSYFFRCLLNLLSLG